MSALSSNKRANDLPCYTLNGTQRFLAQQDQHSSTEVQRAFQLRKRGDGSNSSTSADLEKHNVQTEKCLRAITTENQLTDSNVWTVVDQNQNIASTFNPSSNYNNISAMPSDLSLEGRSIQDHKFCSNGERSSSDSALGDGGTDDLEALNGTSTPMGRTRMQCFKTKMCHFFLQHKCNRGTNCVFAHSVKELRVTPDLSKTKLCAKWEKGQCCVDSALCAYAHGVDDLRGPPSTTIFSSMAIEKDDITPTSLIDGRSFASGSHSGIQHTDDNITPRDHTESKLVVKTFSWDQLEGTPTTVNSSSIERSCYENTQNSVTVTPALSLSSAESIKGLGVYHDSAAATTTCATDARTVATSSPVTFPVVNMALSTPSSSSHTPHYNNNTTGGTYQCISYSPYYPTNPIDSPMMPSNNNTASNEYYQAYNAGGSIVFLYTPPPWTVPQQATQLSHGGSIEKRFYRTTHRPTVGSNNYHHSNDTCGFQIINVTPQELIQAMPRQYEE